METARQAVSPPKYKLEGWGLGEGQARLWGGGLWLGLRGAHGLDFCPLNHFSSPGWLPALVPDACPGFDGGLVSAHGVSERASERVNE